MVTLRGIPIRDIRRLENVPGRQERQQAVTVTGTEEVLTAHPIDTTVAGEERPDHRGLARITAALPAAAYGIAKLRGNDLQYFTYQQSSEGSENVSQHCHQHPDGDECP